MIKFIVALEDTVADYIVAVGCILADCNLAVLGRRFVDCSLTVERRRIAHRLVAPPVDSFGALLVAKFAARFQVPLAPVVRPEKYLSRELLIGRKLDLRSGRHRPAVAWNFAAYVPLFPLLVVELDLEPFAIFHAP